MVETTAKLRQLRMSPRKVRLLADLIRGMSVADARLQLSFSTKHASKPLLKLLNSAVANATHNQNVKEDTLRVKTIFVDGGPVLKRWMPRAFGRASMIRKRTSHITIILEGEADATKAAKKPTAKKVEKKDADAQTTDETAADEQTAATKKSAPARPTPTRGKAKGMKQAPRAARSQTPQKKG